jgi:predicted transglutaminase-like cysteine proteinase
MVTIVLALSRSLANALWQFLLETRWDSYRRKLYCVRGPGPILRQKHNLRDPIADPVIGNPRQTANNHHGARNSVSRCLLVMLCVFCVLVFCITEANAQADVDEPFGLSTVPATDTATAATWEDLLVEINNDLSLIAQCREQFQSCSSLASINFVTIAKKGEGHESLARIGHINRAANLAIRALDAANADGNWRSPLAILSRSSGDCKHYAVLKYAILRELGVSPDALKIIIVEVRSTHQLHAILAVRAERGRWLLLDNRTLMLVESSMALNFYDPLYQLDQNGVRQFALRSHAPQVARLLRPTQMH